MGDQEWWPASKRDSILFLKSLESTIFSVGNDEMLAFLRVHCKITNIKFFGDFNESIQSSQHLGMGYLLSRVKP